MIGRALSCCVLAGAVCFTQADANAQYPNRPIRIVTGFAPGAASDTISRIVGQKFTEAWGPQVIVDNRPGASGMLGAEIVARSVPDGYTLGTVIGALVINPSLYSKMPFDPIRDFTPIALIGRITNVVTVHPSLPVRSIKQLVALAKAQPGKLVYGTGGTGSVGHLTAEMFKQAAGIDMEHIPYKGGAPAMADLVGGQIPLTFSVLLTALPQIKADRIVALAVTSGTRQAVLPEVPTLTESGYPGFDTADWWALVGPAGMPADIVAKLNAEINRMLQQRDVKERFASLAVEAIGGTAEQLGNLMRADLERWARVIKTAGIKSE